MNDASVKLAGDSFEGGSSLQRDLVARIAGAIRDDGLRAGDRLNESRLAERLNVSRTPVRAALRRLADLGYVAREPNRGVTLARLPPVPQREASDEGDDLLAAIARDRGLGCLGEQVSETELMRLYGRGRQTIRGALQRLCDLGSVERRPGYGWSFVNTLRDAQERQESYRFRIVVEVAAILEPGFALLPGWADEMRARHERALTDAWGEHSSVSFYEMNAAFHLGIAAASGNRYVRSAMERQNQLRRLANYHWSRGFERVETNCREHLAILDALERGDAEIAAIAMRRHLEGVARLPFARSN